MLRSAIFVAQAAVGGVDTLLYRAPDSNEATGECVAGKTCDHRDCAESVNFCPKRRILAREGLPYLPDCSSIFQCGASGAEAAGQTRGQVTYLRILTPMHAP